MKKKKGEGVAMYSRAKKSWSIGSYTIEVIPETIVLVYRVIKEQWQVYVGTEERMGGQ